jgi:hypothetical protein
VKKPENGGSEERKETAYPYYDMEASIKFASLIKDLGGSKGGVKKSLLAKQLGLAESTPSFFQRLSAAKTFGIAEGWGEYRLTEIGRKYFYPQSEQAKHEALLMIFLAPRSFAFLVKRFDGDRLPATDIMGNILHQELAIPDSWKDRVAQIFIRSAHFAGIIDNGGFLRYDAEMHKRQPSTVEMPAEVIQVAPTLPPSPTPPVAPEIVLPTSPRGNVWEYYGIRVETPKDLLREHWETLKAYVQILEPSKRGETTK